MYLEQTLPWRNVECSHRRNEECPHFKRMILTFLKSDDRRKDTIDGTAGRAEAYLYIHAKLLHDNS